MNAGQVCIAVKRLYVPDGLYDQVLAELVRMAEGAVMGDATEPGVQIGPVQNRQQFEKVRSLIAEAREDGLIAAAEKCPKKAAISFVRPSCAI